MMFAIKFKNLANTNFDLPANVGRVRAARENKQMKLVAGKRA